jgi:ribonuclease I
LSTCGSATDYGYLIEEARGVLNYLYSWNANHVKQNFNDVAHRLIKEALSLTIEKWLIEEISLCISDIISVERCA